MDLKTFVSAISFSGLQPMDQGIVMLTGTERAPMVSVADVRITRLPEKDTFYKERLEKTCAIPRMSTFAIGAIINRIVADLPEGSAFVNVGVWQGFSLLAGMTGNAGKRCVGIDDFSEFGGPRTAFMERFNAQKSAVHEFYDMDYEKYFATAHTGEIGFYIYDGNHAREHQCMGLALAEPFFSRDCIILVDDINTAGPMDGTIDFLKTSKNKYQLIAEQHTAHNQHPTFWNGIAIFKRMG